MIDFSTLQGLTIPEGVVTQITDAAGNVLWALNVGGPIVLEVEKITSNTYASETTYTGEEFILLDIYPKTNGSVTVTYGGLTKTITDTSGAEEPNAQQVFFGTFNGISDSVETPASGTLTIEGGYRGFGCSVYYAAKSSSKSSRCITAINDFGTMTYAPTNAFWGCSKLTGTITVPKRITNTELLFRECTGLEYIVIPDGATGLGRDMITGCTALKRINIPASVVNISGMGTSIGTGNFKCPIVVDSNNTIYKVDSNCFVEILCNEVRTGYLDSVIPDYIKAIGQNAFKGCSELTSMTIPSAVTAIRANAFYGCTGLTEVTFENTSGWYVTKTLGGDLSTGTAIDVTDPANNVTLLVDTYPSYYWYRS